MDRDQILADLRRAADDRVSAIVARRAAAADLARLIPRARDAGIRVSEIVEITGLSRQGVRDFLHGKTDAR